LTYQPPKKPAPDPDQFELLNLSNLPTPETDFKAGKVILMDKPKGYTSFRIIGLIRKLTGVKKTGHAGTLDPMASGLLIVCTGKATKSISLIQDGTKTYQAEIKFGQATLSYDAETDVSDTDPDCSVSEDQIRKKLKEKFTGEIEQVPPMYSALKIKGERLYHLARRGEEVERKSRRVTIFDAQFLSWNDQNKTAAVEITCSKGTYIRSIAHDLGIECGTFAHLTALRRTVSGSYNVSQALTPQQIVESTGYDGKIDLA